jgi:hypothetical protein
MPWFFVITPVIAAHPEPAFWNALHDWLDDCDPRCLRGGHYFIHCNASHLCFLGGWRTIQRKQTADWIASHAE